MILLRVGTDIVTYKGDQFQIIPTLQDPITQSEFEEHGIEPDVLSGITEEEWALFKQDFNAQTFTVIVFTTYEYEPELLLDYDVISREDFLLTFTSEATKEVEFGLEFAVQGAKDTDLPLEFEGVPISEFLVEFTATGVDSSDFSLEYDALQRYMSDFVIEFVAQTRTSFEQFQIDFAAQMDGTGEFLISFTPRQTSSAEVSLEFEAMPAKSFGIEFTAQGHEVLDITLEWEALQRYFSDLRLEWVAGGSAEGGAEGAEFVVVLHESGCLKVLDAGVLIRGILITDTNDALLEQVVLRRVEDPDGSGYDWKSHFGLK